MESRINTHNELDDEDLRKDGPLGSRWYADMFMGPNPRNP
jgi:hypothetical protein